MSITITPLGGLSQIGGNCCLVENDKISFLIDYGILFPYNDSFDINYLIPNLDQIKKAPDVLFVTHGHEDHIGAIPHLLEKFPGLQIYAPTFAKELIKQKCDFFPRPLDLKISDDIEKGIEIGSVKVDYVRVNHSIPDTYGLAITEEKTSSCTFFISDFKIDETNYFEPPFDFEKLKKLSAPMKNKLLMADSTNILSGNLHTPSEGTLLKDLEEIFARDNNRVIATTFSSNVARIKTLINVARKTGRTVALYGRSLQRYSQTASELGILDDLSNVKDIDHIDVEKTRSLIIVSGCQADFRSTFRRIAIATDSKIKLSSKDIVLLSSKTIPGNEKAISHALNEISKTGAEIITASDKQVHVSGHAGRDDILRVFNEFQPTHHIPIHGETFFLKRHHDHIKSETKAKVKYITNFTSVTYPSFKEFNNYDELDPILIHGNGHKISRERIKERRKVATNGLIIVSYSSKGIKIETLGIEYPNDERELEIKNLIKSEASASNKSPEVIKVNCRRVISQLFGIKPEVVIL